MGDLTPHFSRAEFRDKRAGVSVDVPVRLLGALECLRGMVGRPIIIVSGFRTQATNRAVGGAPHSRHLVGDAVDIPPGVATVDQAAAAGFVGIGNAGAWAIHLDVRPGPPARWSY